MASAFMKYKAAPPVEKTVFLKVFKAIFIFFSRCEPFRASVIVKSNVGHSNFELKSVIVSVPLKRVWVKLR